jgi:hypothetical protein
MIRLYIVVEGQTEESFINELLKPALHGANLDSRACLIGNPGHKGGWVNRNRAERDIMRLLKEDRNAYCTTMFDFFRLGKDFPGLPIEQSMTTIQKVETVEGALYKEIETKVSPSLRPDRFIPYIQMHEFEGLLFSDPIQMAKGMYRENLAKRFEDIARAFPSPEDINDGPNTAPSKRILSLVSDYDKVTAGSLTAIQVGLRVMRKKCSHFNNWLIHLESIGRNR